MNPLELISQLFIKGYGMNPAAARKQASLLLSKPDDPATAQAWAEAQDFDSKTNPAFGGIAPPPQKQIPGISPTVSDLAPSKPVPMSKNLDSAHDIHKAIPPAPLPSLPAAPTPAHQSDADLAAWQRYSDLLKAYPPSPKESGAGSAVGKRN